MLEQKNEFELDLHLVDEDPDLEIAASGVHCNNLDEISNYITEVKDTVKKINLNNQHALTVIPSVLGECVNLEELDISNTEITEIPEFLFSLPNLHTLICCNGKLAAPLPGISKAKKLERLVLRINKDWQFPEEIPLLPELKILDIELDAAVPLHKNLGNLEKLEELIITLHYNEGNAPDLPVSFAKHQTFAKLRVNDPIRKTRKKFNLEKTVQILFTCPAFVSLKLCGIEIGNGHQNLSQVAGIKRLELRHLILEGDVFKSIAGLNKLEKLEVLGSELKINDLPDIFRDFPDLQIFSFAGNIIKELPPSIYSLSKLTNLEIGSTGISKISDDIGKLTNLAKLHLYDNLLDRLPESVFSLPRLEVLDIENNVFSPNDLAEIKEKLGSLRAAGRKIDFRADGQGQRQMIKRLRTLRDIDKLDPVLYFKYCLNAINENQHAIKYVDKKKFFKQRHYAELCIAAVRKNCLALEFVDCSALDKNHYFLVCNEAAKKPDIAHAFKFIQIDKLNNYEYLQVCIEAAQNNNFANFLNCINTKSSMERISRLDYERICWVAILHYPPALSKMIEPTEELILLAEKRGYKLSK